MSAVKIKTSYPASHWITPRPPGAVPPRNYAAPKECLVLGWGEVQRVTTLRAGAADFLAIRSIGERD